MEQWTMKKKIILHCMWRKKNISPETQESEHRNPIENSWIKIKQEQNETNSPYRSLL